MNKKYMWVAIFSAFVALILSVLQTALAAPQYIDNLAGVTADNNGLTWAAIYEEKEIQFYLLAKDGEMQKSFSIPRESDELLAHVAYMTSDGAGSVYFLKQYTGVRDGKYDARQELVVYTPKLLPFGRLKTIRLDDEDGEENIRYISVHVSTSLILTGVDEDGSAIVRKAYDLDMLRDSGSAAVKNTRYYPVSPQDGVYKTAVSGTNIVYLSKSGKVFFSEEDASVPTLLYPYEDSESVSYASFLCESAAGQVIIGEQRSGNILRLYENGGTVEYIEEGGRSFGSLSYSGKDVLDMSFVRDNEASFTAVAYNAGTGRSALVFCDNGEYSLVLEIKSGSAIVFLRMLGYIVLYYLGVFLLLRFIILTGHLITNSRTIFVKLLSASIPLLVLALLIFGTYSHFSYQNALTGTYSTKVKDQGSLLRALFSSASFDKIVAPSMYNSTEYAYLEAQMGTRDVYTSSAYFVDGALYTGVDRDLPCLYPMGISHSATLQELYRLAALTGQQQVDTVTDRFGSRVACVTPIGSSSGNTIFLLETSVFQSEIDRQISGFIRNYLIVSLICLFSACAMLLMCFYRILRPLGEIIGGLERFSKGNRDVRLQSTTNDELADIARVFNKMAKDIDVQIYNLRNMSETYYRFVPQQIFRLLGKENLADVRLDSAVEGDYCILVANLYPRNGWTEFEGVQGLTNRFFEIVHRVCGENGAMLIQDSANLRSLRIICPDSDTAINVAMGAIAYVDGHNAINGIPQRIEASFFLHMVSLRFCICGDSERYIPAIISPELDDILLQCEMFRYLGSRLVVTGRAYAALDGTKYSNRFIGYMGDGNERIELYDFYDSSSPNIIRLISETRTAFDKAMTLYHQNRYYDAKNLFAVVLRENQYDNVARHYVFQCEKKL